MPKTYTAAGSAVAGDVYTAAAHNVIVTNVNNFIVPPALRIRRATLQTITTGVDTFVTWPIEDLDTDGMYTATSDTVTIQTSGLYTVFASVIFAANATGWRVMNLLKNPSSVSDFASVFCANWCPVSSSSQGTTLSASAIQTFTAGDTLKVTVAHNVGSNLDIGNATFTSVTQLSLGWIGRTS
jgi:hypothetical protein